MKPDVKPNSLDMLDYGYFTLQGRFIFHQGWKAAYKKALSSALAHESVLAKRFLARLGWPPFTCDFS